MNTFLVQVGIGGGYSTIIEKGSYTNKHWRGRAEGDISSKRRSEDRYNKDHGIVEPGDQLVVYCASRVPRTHKQRLAFSVIVSKVSADRATFEVEEPQFFSNPLKLENIPKYIEQSKLDECFGCCSSERHQGFNITKLKPTAVQQLYDLGVLDTEVGSSMMG